MLNADERARALALFDRRAKQTQFLVRARPDERISKRARPVSGARSREQREKRITGSRNELPNGNTENPFLCLSYLKNIIVQNVR